MSGHLKYLVVIHVVRLKGEARVRAKLIVRDQSSNGRFGEIKISKQSDLDVPMAAYTCHGISESFFV